MSALAPLRGRVALVLDEPDFDVDHLVGIENIKLQEPAALARLVLERHDQAFRDRVRPGDVLVGGVNFGFGHPHYPPMTAMRHLGIAGVIAESFSPGYWRGEISMGFPQVACPGILGLVRRWELVEVDWASGLVRNVTRGTELPFEPLSAADAAMIGAGGLIGYLKTSLQEERHGRTEI